MEYIFISLDIFRKTIENSGINSDEKAWLAFLCMDEPKTVIDLIERYPRFQELYEDVYEICRNMEDFMDIFSKELRTLDKNTVRYMIDQMQEDIDRQKEAIDRQKETIERQKKMLDQLEGERKLEQKEKEQEHQKVVELQNQLQEVLNRLSVLENRKPS